MKTKFTLLRNILPLALVTLLGCISLESKAVVREIESYNFYFLGDTTYATVGDTIRFINKEGVHQPQSTTIPSSAQPFTKEFLNVGDTLLYVVAIPGTYDFICTKHSEMTGTIVVGLGTAITNVETERSPKLYPQPFRNMLTIDLNSVATFKKAVTIEVTNGRGQRKYYTVSSDILSAPYTMDLSDLVPGMYFISLSEGNIKKTYRLVKAQ